MEIADLLKKMKKATRNVKLHMSGFSHKVLEVHTILLDTQIARYWPVSDLRSGFN